MNPTITSTLERVSELPPSDSTLTGAELAPIKVLLPAEPFASEAAWIRRQHEQIGRDHLAIVARSIEIGKELIRIQKELGYGKWGGWAARNLPKISERHLRRYKNIARRQHDPLAHEDPQAFLASVYGNLDDAGDDDPSEGGSNVNVRTENGEAAATNTTSSDVNVRSENGKAAATASSKRTAKSRKPKALPVSTSTATTKPISNKAAREARESLPPDIRVSQAAEKLDELYDEWSREYFEPLLEIGEISDLSEEVADGLEKLSDQLDKAIPAIVERLREFSRRLES